MLILKKKLYHASYSLIIFFSLFLYFKKLHFTFLVNSKLKKDKKINLSLQFIFPISSPPSHFFFKLGFYLMVGSLYILEFGLRFKLKRSSLFSFKLLKSKPKLNLIKRFFDFLIASFDFFSKFFQLFFLFSLN